MKRNPAGNSRSFGDPPRWVWKPEIRRQLIKALTKINFVALRLKRRMFVWVLLGLSGVIYEINHIFLISHGLFVSFQSKIFRCINKVIQLGSVCWTRTSILMSFFCHFFLFITSSLSGVQVKLNHKKCMFLTWNSVALALFFTWKICEEIKWSWVRSWCTF